jgi:trans-AT polyketide synthase/acyltransferase/oxidoreductase domain-containing protein
MTIAWLFPGQGSQHVGMGNDAFQRFPQLVGQASEVLGWDLRAQCLDGGDPGLIDTRYVQPALFVVEALQARGLTEDGERPDIVAGHSLGEYVALHVAGALDLLDGVRLVAERGACMSDGGASTSDVPGGMLAVVGLTADELGSRLLDLDAADIDLANENSHEQVVLAGPVPSLQRVAKALRELGVGRGVMLRVSAAFHSRYMRPAESRLARALRACPFADPSIPVLSNVTARPYDPGAARDLLLRQLTSPVRWRQCQEALQATGVDQVREVGPGTVLTGLWAKAPQARATAKAPVATPPLHVASPPVAVVPPQPRPEPLLSQAERLGSPQFRSDYGVDLACVSGSLYRGIASVDLVARMSRGGMLGFLGAGGLPLAEVEAAIGRLEDLLGRGGRFGVNLIAQPDTPGRERELVDCLLRHAVRFVEVSAFTGVTRELVRFRAAGAQLLPDGRARAASQLLAKVSRPEVAAAFLAPPPPQLLASLVTAGDLSEQEARAAAQLPMATDVCVEADSGGHTDGGNPLVLLPVIRGLRDEQRGSGAAVRIGAAGGLGCPDAVAAAFVMGADFVLTGSINQCTVEAGTSDAVKDLLAAVDVSDTAYAPAGDLFELGARVQVVRRQTLFAARANKLYQLYRQYDSLEAVPEDVRRTLEERYYRRTLDQAWQDVVVRYANRPEVLRSATENPRVRMALVFRSFFSRTTVAAMSGDPADTVNYQIHCGPAMGAFNRHVAGTALQDWRQRHVDEVNRLLMDGAAAVLAQRAPRQPDDQVRAGLRSA